MTKAQLDREVAIKIMDMNSLKMKNIPKYSSNMSEAIKVLEEMRLKGHRWLLISCEQGFFLRHLADVTHDLLNDQKKYTADRPMGSVAQTPAELAKLICEVALQEIEK